MMVVVVVVIVIIIKLEVSGLLTCSAIFGLDEPILHLLSGRPFSSSLRMIVSEELDSLAHL
jgi:hypothetical protein